MADLNLLHGTVTDGGGNKPFANPANANDGNALTAATRGLYAFTSNATDTYALVSDLGAAYQVSGHSLGTAAYAFHSDTITIQSSPDGTTWTTRYGPTAFAAGTVTPTHTAFTARYWKAIFTVIRGPGFGSVGTVQIHKWEIIGLATPVASFTMDDDAGTAPHTVQFTDTSTQTPTSWLWDFGDGATSTLQNPQHTYTVPGNYTVSLTATNAEGSGDVSDTVSVLSEGTPVPPGPAQALVEIYAALPGSYRWDEALWDEAVWSGSGWRDVTPQSMNARIKWGSSQPEQGILARPEAGSWAIAFYDPDRILDPANPDSPFFGDLKPGLPVRITHRGVTIRQGKAESLGHNYETETGYFRVVDSISDLARSEVPEDTELADTLYARARDAIAAAGLSVAVLPDPPTGDPALVAWVTGTAQSAWDWIADGALSVLHTPYIDATGRLGFRRWAAPLNRGRVIGSPELVSLSAVRDTNGLVSVVRAFDGMAMIERRITPPPAYGVRVHERDEETLNAGDWAQAILEDRSTAVIRWMVNELYPLTAASVETWAATEAVETATISYPQADPPVSANVVIVGGEIILTPKAGDEARWAFMFHTSQAAPLPLYVDDTDPPEPLFHETSGEWLYPDGTV